MHPRHTDFSAGSSHGDLTPNWIYRTAREQRQALDRGEISAVQLVEASIAQCEQVEPHLNALALTVFDRARESAHAADKALARRKGGDLCGIPVTIKDSQWLAGFPCANGSLTLQDFIPGRSSAAVERLEQAGAVILAKTTCPEFSLSGITESALYGRTSNPWDISRTPGGSSGGAAAAVAAGMGALALGGDGGGSIRIPSAFCGVAGFKPGYGVVPRAPGFKTWESIVAYGPMARSVDDLELMFGVLSGQPVSHAETHDRLDRIIASPDLGFAPVDEDVKRAFQHVLNILSESGTRVHRDNPGISSSVVTWAITATRDMWEHKQHMMEHDQLGDHAKGFMEFGAGFSDSEVEDARLQRAAIHDAYIELFKRNRCNILITPTLGCEAFHHGAVHPPTLGKKEVSYPWLDWAGFLYDANLAGLPACSIPM